MSNDFSFIKPVRIALGGQDRVFDLNDPGLPKWVRENRLSSGNYPYEDKMDREDYEEALLGLQRELVKVQRWLKQSGERLVVLFEGRDAAGKGGTIKTITAYMNPRHTSVVALSKPTETERGQWYFQRYIAHLPTTGEMTFFDRSWYNRAGVEPVMGFCSETQHFQFLSEAPEFERRLVNDGIHLVKFWLNVGRETQLKRFHDRRHSLLRSWKLSPIDLKALTKWNDYTRVRDQMFEATHTDYAPWTVVRTNDKRRGRLNAIRHLLDCLDYEGKDERVIGEVDAKIVGQGTSLLAAGE